jgi:histidyl-tRNA synthetase
MHSSNVVGSHDFLPRDILLQRWLGESIESVLFQYGFSAWDAPLLEYRKLYTDDSNQDLVNQQALVFPDHAGEQVVLRPELTPSLARVVATYTAKLQFPLRWYSYGPFWRNERLVPGRGREFRQWNIDMIGVPEPVGDVELVLQAIDQLRHFNLSDSDVVLKVNNRAILRDALAQLGIAESIYPQLLRLIDQRSKNPDFPLESEAARVGISSEEIRGVASYLADETRWKQDGTLAAVFAAAQALGWEDYLQYDPAIVRFPLYYTGLVFEAFDRAGKYPAILGGGRYDQLVSHVGGKPLPGIGFAIGNITIIEVLKAKGDLPVLEEIPPYAVIATDRLENLSAVHALAQQMHTAGIRVETDPGLWDGEAVRAYCQQRKARFLVFVDAPEANSRHLTIIDIENHETHTGLSFQAAMAILLFGGQKPLAGVLNDAGGDPKTILANR